MKRWFAVGSVLIVAMTMLMCSHTSVKTQINEEVHPEKLDAIPVVLDEPNCTQLLNDLENSRYMVDLCQTDAEALADQYYEYEQSRNALFYWVVNNPNAPEEDINHAMMMYEWYASECVRVANELCQKNADVAYWIQMRDYNQSVFDELCGTQAKVDPSDLKPTPDVIGSLPRYQFAFYGN